MHPWLQFVQQHQDLINLLFGMVSAVAGALLAVVRWLQNRLREEIRFSPATALALGYFNNFLLPAGRGLAGKAPVNLAGPGQEACAPLRKLQVVIPATAAGATRDGIHSYHRSLEQKGMRVVPAQLEDASRPLSLHALIRPDAPDTAPILFDCPSALGNLAEIIGFHLAASRPNSARGKREKLERREIGIFTQALRRLIDDHQLGDVLLLGDASALA